MSSKINSYFNIDNVHGIIMVEEITANSLIDTTMANL